MKKIYLFLMLICLSIPALLKAQEKQFTDSPERNNPEISTVAWEQVSIDLGYIMQNKPVDVSYKFTNHGNRPVVIEEIKTSCGCTAAKHSQEPILPGETSSIDVTYHAGKPGVFHKTIRVKTSADNNYVVLTISGEVQ